MRSGAGAEPTRLRVLGAAKREFARHGIAGARIDRVATAAKTSKERVYAHFGSKEQLYRVVSAQELEAAAEATQLDPADLPAYTGRMFDYFVSHPECYRLMMWGRLELDDAKPPADGAVHAANSIKIEQIRQAQRAGDLDAAWDPVDVLALANQIAVTWLGQPELLPSNVEQREAFLHERRATAVRAMQRLFPAATVA